MLTENLINMFRLELLARQFNCDAVVATLIAEYSAKSFSKQGFECVKSVNYDTYEDIVTGDRIFEGLSSEMKCSTLSIRLLNNN